MKKISKVFLAICLMIGIIPAISVSAIDQTLSIETLNGIVEQQLKVRADKVNKRDKSLGEYDEAVSLIALMEGHGEKLKNYEYSFTTHKIENVQGNIVITGYLVQTFFWEGESPESAMGDDVSFVINKTKKINKVNYPQSLVKASEIVNKANSLKATYNFDENTTKKTEVTTLASNSWTPYTYNGTKAAEYASKYAINNNSSQYYTFGNDCTNFASQALFAGGIPMRKDTGPHESRPNWWIQFYDAGQFLYAVPWVNANEFYLTIRGTNTIDGYEASTPQALYLGDIISYDKGNDLNMDHTAVVTSFVNTPTQHTPRVSYHTTNRKDVSWDYFILNTPGTVTAEFTRIQ
ncbi:amidase domain-containing protein [Paenibacillus sp. GSMTC-2017]|uniref:amidase domain-containing protein n=1 Tax=Paenibacillus sp. GSMTC-2017 TaxID=2794350 RepID=UPI0018D7CB4D|nr:amidase domain-containing protein [Paenibacillus sp. GSMTC-2017]MBH5319952.1 amidase domain-containing protein [Paenibacillus sp. GSMTC-2017]